MTAVVLLEDTPACWYTRHGQSPGPSGLDWPQRDRGDVCRCWFSVKASEHAADAQRLHTNCLINGPVSSSDLLRASGSVPEHVCKDGHASASEVHHGQTTSDSHSVTFIILLHNFSMCTDEKLICRTYQGRSLTCAQSLTCTSSCALFQI